MSKHYVYYGTNGPRRENYQKGTKAFAVTGLQMRHSNKTEQASSMQFKSEYDKLDATTKSALDKFTNKPDSQLTSAERDSLYRIEPWFYLQYVRNNYPNKKDFHNNRLKSFTGFKRNMEDNGLVPKEPSETQAARQMVENTEAPIEQARPAETNTNQSAATPEKQAAQDMVNFTLVGDSYSSNPNFRLRGEPYYSPAPVPYKRPPAKETGFEPRTDLDTINLVTGRGNYSMSPARYYSLSSILGRNEPMLMGLTAAGALGLGGLGLYGRYKYGDIEQSQTQVPYRMESEPVNEDVVQPESTLEQQYVTQNTPSFSTKINNLFDLYQRQEQLMREKEVAASQAYQNALEMGQRIATGTGYAPELKEENFVFPQELPDEDSNIKTANLESPDGGEVPQELNKLAGVKPKVIKDTPNGSVVLNDPNHRKTRDVQNNSVTPEQAAAKKMVNQYAGIPVEVARAKNSGYTPPFLTTDAIWDRVRKAGLSSPEQAIRSGLFTPTEVRYITENDLWRYR